MTTPKNTALGAELWMARQSGDLVANADHPSSIASAYELLASVTAASGRDVMGYKLGATADAALEMLQLTEPFAGPLLDGACLQSDSEVTVYPAHKPGIEAEFVFGLSRDLPTNGALTENDVSQCIGWIAGGFEIVSARFADTPTGRGLCTIGDGAGNFAVITGAPHADWQALDLTALPVKLIINGKAVASSTSKDSIFGSPLAMLTWFVNSDVLPARGLRSGDIIYCGTCTGLIPIKPGDEIEADYGVLGTVCTSIKG